MAYLRDWSYARQMARGEQELHSYRDDPGGLKSANIFGGDLIAALAADTGMSDADHDEISDEPMGWIRKAVTGDFDRKTGRRVHTAPREDRKKRFDYFLYKSGLMLDSDWLPHLVDMPKAQDYARKQGLNPYADQAIMGGRIFYDFLHEDISDDRATFMVLQFAHLEPRIDRPEPFIRARRFTLIIERQPLERPEEFETRVREFDSDFGFMDDQLANIGSDWGAVFDPTANTPPTQVSAYEWQFRRKNRIIGFNETAPDGSERHFTFARECPEIAKIRAVQAKVDQLNQYLEAAE